MVHAQIVHGRPVSEEYLAWVRRFIEDHPDLHRRRQPQATAQETAQAHQQSARWPGGAHWSKPSASHPTRSFEVHYCAAAE
jgi:hypothetical protein